MKNKKSNEKKGMEKINSIHTYAKHGKSACNALSHSIVLKFAFLTYSFVHLFNPFYCVLFYHVRTDNTDPIPDSI